MPISLLLNNDPEHHFVSEIPGKFYPTREIFVQTQWTSNQICKIAGCAVNAGNVFLSDPDMRHGTCVSHVPRCMLGSLTSGFHWSRWQRKRSRHSRPNAQFCVFGKRPMLNLGASFGSYHCKVYVHISQIRLVFSSNQAGMHCLLSQCIYSFTFRTHRHSCSTTRPERQR